MGAMFDSLKMRDGRSAGELIRERARNGLANANPRGGMLGAGLRMAQQMGAFRQQQRQPDPAQPAQPRSEPALGSMFSSKPDRAMYGSGRQMQKGWWP